MKRIVFPAALLLILAVVGTGAAQNLLVNPNFDSDLSGWSIFPIPSDYAVTWTGAMGANAPGAAQIDVNAAAAENTYVFQQCVAVSPSTSYDFGAHVRFPSGVAQIPTARLQVQWYTGGGCSGPDGSSASSSTVNSPDTWQSVTGTSRMSPAGATGAMISTVFQTPAGGTSQLWFDDIYFGPSTPSTLTHTWVPVASHNGGKNNSQWRSDLGLLNTGVVTAHVQINFHGGTIASSSVSVPAGTQSILTDVVGQVGGSNSGALEIVSDQPLKITARSYNQVASDAACYAAGTQGQDYPAVVPGDGMSETQSAYLGGLVENKDSYHTNIGVVNTGDQIATVLVELFDGAGTELAEYPVTLNPGDWKQETQPYKNKAGTTSIARGYAKVTVTSGSGVFAFASVVDNTTNDPTTIAMQPSLSQAGAQFTQQGNKLVGTGAAGVAIQGFSVAISADGTTAIVGGPNDNLSTTGEGGDGAAWVYTHTAAGWLQQGNKLSNKLVGTGFVGPADQGWSVALSADGNTAIVGGPGDNSNTGAVWVFTREFAEWFQQGDKLVGTGGVGSSGFGGSVAISADGNTAIVGGSGDSSGVGAAWVLTRTGGVWSQQGDKLVGTGAVGFAGQGGTVAISGDGNTAVIGGVEDNSEAGAAWIFTRSGSVWSQQGDKLVGTGAVNPAGQGSSVAISADGAIVMIGGSDDNFHSGAAWVFTRSASAWFQQGGKLVGTGAVEPSGLGVSVALSGDGNTAVVGGQEDNSRAGAAWVFTRSGGVWSRQSTKLVGTGAAGVAWQGVSTAISGDGGTVILGGPADSSWAGAAWIFSASTYATWVPVASHNGGKNNSQWRSDLGLLNTGAVTAQVQINFHGGTIASSSVSVPAGTQSILTDVVGQVGGSNSGALEIVSDQPLKITARSYNQVASDAACYAAGTQGQDYPAVVPGDGMSETQSAYLGGLVENKDSYHTNIGVVNTGDQIATVLVELFDGAGTELAEYPVTLNPGDWKQETQPFFHKAAQTAMDRGYAKVTVQTGSGVFAFASVVDGVTNDPTTVTMQQ